MIEFYLRIHSNNELFLQGYGEDLRAKSPTWTILYDIYLNLILIIETKFRLYDNDWQYKMQRKDWQHRWRNWRDYCHNNLKINDRN